MLRADILHMQCTTCFNMLNQTMIMYIILCSFSFYMVNILLLSLFLKFFTRKSVYSNKKFIATIDLMKKIVTLYLNVNANVNFYYDSLHFVHKFVMRFLLFFHSSNKFCCGNEILIAHCLSQFLQFQALEFYVYCHIFFFFIIHLVCSQRREKKPRSVCHWLLRNEMRIYFFS